MRQDNIAKGSRAEGKFIADCISLGFNLAMPITRTSYDFLVDTNERIIKVQVKSVSRIDKSSRGEKVKCMLTRGSKNGKRAYTEKHTDFIALWVEPVKAWYFLPIAEISGKLTISLFPTVLNSTSKYERFREAWDIL